MEIDNQLTVSYGPHRACRLCKSAFSGRADKLFCSVTCKSQYHIKLNKVTMDAASRIDRILHRNRSILLEIMGKESMQKQVNRAILDSKKFNFSYVTQFYVGAQNELVNFIYDFSWVLSDDQEVHIRRIGVMAAKMKRAA
jgi:hypothetical protein